MGLIDAIKAIVLGQKPDYADDSSRQPLLPKALEDNETVQQVKSLPWHQIAVLMLMRLSEPIAFTNVLPFINQMVQDTSPELTPTEVGYWSGLIESAFFICQFATILQWGRLSDRIGRKPILLIGLLGVSVSVFAFGWSKTFWQMIAARCVAGVLNGNVGIIKSSVAEITNSENESVAFGLLPLSYSVGAALGPLIGGIFVNPAKQYPKTFGKSAFFRNHPYVLPCGVAAVFPLLAMILATFTFKETLTVKAKENANEASGSTTLGDENAEAPAPPSIRSLLTPRVFIVLLSYCLLSFMSMSIAILLPLFSYTPVENGGLGVTPRTIGAFMSGQAICIVLASSIGFPILQKWLGTIPTYRLMLWSNPLAVVMLPLASRAAENNKTTALVLFGFALFFLSLGNIVYSCNMLIINNAAPSKAALGSMNGLAQSCSSLMRALAPAASTSLFAFSTERQIAGGNLIWIVLLVLTALTIGCSFFLPAEQPSWRDGKEDD